MVARAGLFAQIESMELEYDGETTVTFSVTYRDEVVNTLLSAPISGTLPLEEVEDVLLVRNVILK